MSMFTQHIDIYYLDTNEQWRDKLFAGCVEEREGKEVITYIVQQGGKGGMRVRRRKKTMWLCAYLLHFMYY